ncbi:hypothetical protein RJ640_029176 [Escallonia rubra]|uniref:GH10 domain-containing protein n=1 Tax=Escallonia rubra TaxID=112253 RepID=A0AA88UWI6_9ASTE|nr:hypothetical protein RJ640_029176 [Escallonia rubra]
MKDSPSSAFLLLLLFVSSSLAFTYDGPLYDYSAYTEVTNYAETWYIYSVSCAMINLVYNFKACVKYHSGYYNDSTMSADCNRRSHFTMEGYSEISCRISNGSLGTIKAQFLPLLWYYGISTKLPFTLSPVELGQNKWSRFIRTHKGNPDDRTHDTRLHRDCFGEAGMLVVSQRIKQYENELIDLLLQHSDDTEINIEVTSASLQPFSEQQWRFNQQYSINTVSTTTNYIRKKAVIKYKLTLVQKRKRAVTIHVSDRQGGRLQGAAVMVEQVSRDFPFGSAIAKTILGNLPYQNWFVKRFNAAVFENELKWSATEPKPGQINYIFADQMLEFVRANQISARGHNIFWEDPKYTPAWVQNLTGSTLQSAVNSRIKSLMSRYKEEFIHWDVSNEMLHFDFYEQRLGPNATLHFYEMAHQFDPLATLFMNEFNVVETCSDDNTTVDAYISRMRELKQGGVSMDGIGLEGHFSVPNLPLMRAILDKLATLGLPIWLTEVDISNKLNEETQAIYLEEVLREGFSHPSVDGIMLWTALHPYGCYQMCLTDNDFHNLPAGDTVDKLLNEWQTGIIEDQTDEQGSYSFYGFLGEYKAYVETNSTKKIRIFICISVFCAADGPLYDYSAYTEHSDDRDVNIAVTSASLQPFTKQQWRFNQQYKINTERKRAVTIHVSDRQGERLHGATITLEQVSKSFPFGSAIANTIIGNVSYQNWFVKRFNAAVYENELKWYAIEPKPGQANYTIADKMLEFVRANQIIARGHNIFWENPKYNPTWVQNLTGSALQSAVNSRIQSLMSKYREDFIHWDVSNEMLHFDFYEQRLGPNATLHFYELAHEIDPLATLFMNEFNVVETCGDVNSTVDTYISKIRDLKQGGVSMDGIGLEGHFTVPNLPLMRAILDKLATLKLPIWLTEIDISNKLDAETQATYLEEVLREGFSHPSVNGMMLWTALHRYGCYQMCLTDNDLKNLPAGDTVDKLLNEWQTGFIADQTDEQGSYSFFGFLGEYNVTAKYDDDDLYDYSAYTECKAVPEDPLYNGWVKTTDSDSAVIKASLTTDNSTYKCIGTVIAKSGCWSFLKGGFVLHSPANYALLYFQNSDGREMNITVASASLQPFTYQQWRTSQQHKINSERKRAVTIHVSDVHGDGMQGAEITVEQISRDFPFGSAIAKTILANLPYQSWFLERFNAAVFEDELKWYSTEPQPGQVNYTIPDQMLEFVRANQITARGHNIFWENPAYTPAWVRNLTSPELKLAVNSRIQSLMSKYKNEFIHWDVSNEMLHYDFYEQRLGPNATLHFFETAHQSDPLATLFMNDFNVVETCNDVNSTVDAYISRLRELERGGVSTDGIGLEGHFTIPNPPLIRAVLDKLATLQLPIWLTEVDISNTLDKETQATYLEVVLREGFSHPAVNGIMLWTALHPYGCYEMCLTDNNLRNLPAGDVVDKLLKEWQTGVVGGQTDDHGSFSFDGFLGEYIVTASYANKTANSTFALCQGDETRHFSIQL